MIYHISEEKMFMDIMERMGVFSFKIYYLGPQGKNGKNGGKFTIRVPIGTLIYEVKCE